MNQIELVLKAIKSSPLFYLFASSKELFHTNFWYWLSIQNPAETIKILTGANAVNNNYSFEREHFQNHNGLSSKVDLLIRQNNVPIYVIENKIKDFARQGQLDRIRNTFNNNGIDFILTTLFTYAGLQFNGWTIRTYRQISNAINPNNFPGHIYYKDLISDYKEFVSNLSDLASNLPATQDYDFTIAYNRQLFYVLDNVKMWEAYIKFRSSHMLHHYHRPYGFIETNYGVNDKSATINFTYPLPRDYKIGIQLQGDQFRKFIEGRDHAGFAQNLLLANCFFDPNWESPRGHNLLKYDPNFKYQYDSIARLAGNQIISFNNLFGLVNNELNNIHQQINQIIGLIP